LLWGSAREDAADSGAALKPMATKIANLRIFRDSEHNMNRSLLESGGGVLAVSQFTLHADCRRGRRPGFSHAAPPELARAMFDQFVDETAGVRRARRDRALRRDDASGAGQRRAGDESGSTAREALAGSQD